MDLDVNLRVDLGVDLQSLYFTLTIPQLDCDFTGVQYLMSAQFLFN